MSRMKNERTKVIYHDYNITMLINWEVETVTVLFYNKVHDQESYHTLLLELAESDLVCLHPDRPRTLREGINILQNIFKKIGAN